MAAITVQDVVVETIKKGKNSYQVANVTYTTDRGENKAKKVMSFSNPAVFAVAKDAKQGEAYEVSYTPGDQYYNWATIKRVSDNNDGFVAGAGSITKQAAPASGKVLGSTYETAEERKIKQMYIIKQSSISNALEYMKQTRAEGDFGVNDVTEVAQKFVDWVYGNDVKESLTDMTDDIPY